MRKPHSKRGKVTGQLEIVKYKRRVCACGKFGVYLSQEDSPISSQAGELRWIDQGGYSQKLFLNYSSPHFCRHA